MANTSVALVTDSVIARTGDQDLWQRLLAFKIDQPGPYPFSKRLAKENEWPYEFALQVIEEYRKFLFLLCTVDENLVASPDVELCWRLHLIYTTCYWGDLCRDVLKRQLSHNCEDGSESPARLAARFEKTLEAYRACFGEPPVVIWFAPDFMGGPLIRRWQHSLTWSREGAGLLKARGPMIENIPAEHRALWKNIKAFRFDRPGAAYPYSRRLADENGWDHDYALVVIDEYRKFLFLLKTTKHWVTPSLDVDEAWHLHLDHTDLYWRKMCEEVLGQKLHHHPGNGSEEGEARFKAIYERTLHDYAQHFGEPPFRVWGKPNPNLDWAAELEGSGY